MPQVVPGVKRMPHLFVFSDLEWWANVTGLVGFAVTIGGFIWTIRTANAARKAAEDARNQITTFDAAAALSSARSAIDESKRLHRIGAWDVALDRYSTARALVISVRFTKLLNDDDSQRKLTSVISHLSGVEDAVEARQRVPEADQMPIERVNRILAAAADLLTEVQSKLKS